MVLTNHTVRTGSLFGSHSYDQKLEAQMNININNQGNKKLCQGKKKIIAAFFHGLVAQRA